MTTEANSHTYPPVPDRRLWLGVAAGPVLWAIHLVVVYAIQSVSCHWGFFRGSSILGIETLNFILGVISVVAAAGIVAGGILSYRNYRTLAGEPWENTRWAEARPSFMAITGLLMAALFLLSLIFSLVAIVMLRPCSLYWW